MGIMKKLLPPLLLLCACLCYWMILSHTPYEYLLVPL